MEKNLEEYLNLLNSDRCLNNQLEAKLIIEKIGQCFKEEHSQFTVNLLLSLILDENDAIFNFIWRTSLNFETTSSASAGLKLLEFFVTDLKKSTEPYFGTIFDKCLQLVDTDFAKVKELALKIIKILITSQCKVHLDLSKLAVKIENCLQKDKKGQGTVLEQVYSILGVMFDKYPEIITKNVNWYFEQMSESLQSDIKLQKNLPGHQNFSSPRMKGIFEGIDGFLRNHPPPDIASIRKIYEHIKKLGEYRHKKSNSTTGAVNLIANRAALKLFESHWKHFAEFAYYDQDFWLEKLKVWIKQESEDRRCGYNTLNSFYRMIAYIIKRDALDHGILKQYLNNFMDDLKLESSDLWLKKSALVGLKFFVLTNVIDDDELTKLHDLVMDLVKTRKSFSNFAFLPLSVECLSAFVLKLSYEDVDHLFCLQKLSVTLINQYPKMETDFQSNHLIALEKSFYFLAVRNVKLLENHIDRVIYQGLIRSCSLMTLVDGEILKESSQTKVESYKSYISLWKHLLNLASSPNKPVDGSMTLKKDVAYKVFDAFIKSFLKIVSKLNLNADLDNFGLEVKVEVERPSDVQIFTNVVDLYQDVIPLTDPFILSKWIIKIMETVMRLSYQHPLVSGFYKIMTATLKVADGIQFFDDRVKGDFKDQCFESLKIFLEEVLLRVDQYKSDLQTVCLETVLAAPASLIEGFAEKMVPALEVVINLSRGNFSLLKELVKTLERWNSSFEPSIMNPMLEKLLPYFDVFFQSPYFRGTSVVGSRTEGKYLKRKLIFDDSELLKLQKRLLIFIGDLNMGTAMNLIESKETGEWRSIKDKSIVYRLPYNDGKSEINLDEMLPRIVELALCSGHRKTRITACESLYSTVMVVLSHVNQLNGGFSQVFRNVFRTCVTLACDSDSVVHQIFEPLTFQMIHYFSGKKAVHFTETQDVIDILIEFVTLPYDPTTRDLAAVLLREFTIWTIKQLTPEEMKTTPDNIYKILRSIYSLTLHPSYNKRLGGAVIFNRLYVVLREEDLILDAHWFLFFYHFMECLRMCEEREDVTEITAAIRHVMRPLIERHEEFNEPSTIRVVPPEFEGNLLEHLVKWCLKRCTDAKARTRQMAMSAVEALASKVKNCDSLKAFVDTHLPGTIFERKSSVESFSGEEPLIRWLSNETATVEYYRWLFEQRIVTAEKLFEYNLNDLSKDFVVKLNSVEGKGFNVDLLKKQSVISFLKLVFALRAHFYLFPLETLKLLQISIFQPSKFGFDLNKTEHSRFLFTILSDLMKHFAEEWTEISWKNFYENLARPTIPDFEQIAKSNSIDIEYREVLFAIKVMEVSGLWAGFAKWMAIPTDGNHIVKRVYESLFHEDEKRSWTASLNPSPQAYLAEFLKVGLKTVEDINQALEFIENEEKVVDEDSQKVVTKGEYFQTTFRNEIFGFLRAQGDFLVNRIKKSGEAKCAKLVIQVLENEDGEKARIDLAFSLLVCWKELAKTEIKNLTLKQRGKLLLQVGLSTGKAIGTLGCLKTTSVADSIYYLADDCRFENLCPDEIEKIFNFLPYLSHFGEGLDENERLKDFLNKFLIEQNAFEELKSKKGPAKSSQVHVVRGLLESLRLTGSLVVFDFVLKMVICLEKLTTKEEVESALSVFGDEKTTTQHATNALNLAYDHCFKDRTMFSSNVSFIYDWFLDPLMRKVSTVAFREFVTDKLVDLSNFLLSKSAENYSRNTRVETKRKLCGSMILRMFVRKLSKEELDNVPPEKKEAMNDLVKNCINLFGSSCQTGPKEERRKYLCGIFNLLCSIISSRSADEKVYRLFLFDDRISFMYEAIVSDQKYDLGMDFEEMPERQKHLTSLRKAITKELQMSLGKTVDSIKYVQTNTLFSSSLREDVTKFDLSVSPIRPVTSVKEQESSEMMEIELEMDSLNNHECMATLVGIVTKMVEDNITPLPAENERVTSLPTWLSFFLGVLKNVQLSKNLKIFVLKTIYNVQEYVKAYRSEAFPVVLNSVLDLFTEGPINYFLIDLIEMMIMWGKGWQELSPIGSNLTKLVVLVMDKSDAVRRDIVKNNIEIAKTMVEVWKESLVKSHLSTFVFDRCQKSFTTNLENESDGVAYLNAHLCGVLLSNGIPAWIPNLARPFFDFLLENFRADNKNNKLFAEICGLSLDLLSKTGAFELTECETLVRDKISREGASGLVLLYSVYKHYPNMTSSFIFKIFTSAWNSVDSFTVKKLEMLLSYLSRPEELEDDTFASHSYSFLSYMLGSPELEVQESCVQIVGKLLDKVKNVKIKSLVEEVLKLQNSVHACVRRRVYEVAVKFYSRGQYEADDLRKQCKVVLLKGLNDGEEEAEEYCLKFWQETLASSSSLSPYSILSNIFREMYAPEAEDCFLNIAVKLLIASASISNKYDESVSPHPITCDDKFTKRELVLGIRQTYLLGLMSSSSRTVSSLENMASLKSSSLPYLRPTAGSLKFEPTVATSPKKSGFDLERVEQSRVPRNPFKRRFFKSSTKTNLYYARWQKAKKKKEVEKDEELIRKRDEEVNVFGVYRDGDYPDIQINHRQVLKPLEVLARKDHQIARQFLVSFYSGLIKTLGEKERCSLLSETKILFEMILTNSFRFDASVFGFVFSILLNHCRNLEIDCRKISTAATSSKLFSLGALIIEEIISGKDSEETVGVKRQRGVTSCEDTRWLELARLYRNLEEMDVLSGIFLDKLNVEGKARKAICYESNLRWSSAFKCYESLLDTVLEPLQNEVFTESYLSCLAKLSDWSSVNKCVRGTCGEDVEDVWRNDSLLYWFVKSETMLMLQSNKFETDLKSLATDDSTERLEALNVNFGEELAVYDWLSGKLQRAKCRIDRLCVDFLASWSHLNQWSTNLRASKLTNLQTIAELSHAIKILSEGSKSRVEQDVKETTERWKRNLPSQLDDLMIWDVKMNYRKHFIEKLKDFNLTKEGVYSNLALVKAALDQENLNLVKEYLMRVKECNIADEDVKVECDYYMNLGKVILAKVTTAEENCGWEIYLSVWRSISKKVSRGLEVNSETLRIHNYRCYTTLGRLVSVILPLVTSEDVSPTILEGVRLQLNVFNCDRVAPALKKKGLEYLELAREVSETLGSSSIEKSNAYLELTKYLLKFSDSNSSSEAENLVRYLLKSMALGHAEARELFGSGLNTLQFVSETVSMEALKSESDLVPSWMFLTWINQILAFLPSKSFPFLRGIVHRIAIDYPNAIRYPFSLSNEKWDVPDPEVAHFITFLTKTLLNDSLYQSFLRSVTYLASPDLILRYHLESILQSLTAANPKFVDVKLHLKKLYSVMFSEDFNAYRGSVFKFWDKFKKPLQDLIDKEDEGDLEKVINDILKSIKSQEMSSKKSMKALESYSPWLARFHSLKVDGSLELPGQYDGSRKPIEKYLVKISSFKTDVVIFDSKCRPMRVGILGNDASVHKFLVKFGEDLRQDERIQQVFKHVNQKLRESKQRRKLYLDTYKVIPMTLYLGMIEWIDDEISLHEMMESSLGKDADLMGKAQNRHLAFLSQGSTGVRPVTAHLIGYQSITRSPAVSNFNLRVQEFPRDLLKKSFWSLATSPEHFIHLRASFAISHAVMSFTHWLVGIGDRHLQNTLVSTKTGRVLGIDFGYAFGVATQFLTPPELIPFRLTPQILNLMDPLKESGWIKQTMIHCSRVLREESLTILSILEVFAVEPVMNWSEQARKSPRGLATDSDRWNPKEKIEMVGEKLKGVNPIVVFEKELLAGHSQSQHLNCYLEVLKGDEQNNFRARCNTTGLTDEEQVECLIDLATDPHVLAKTYVGWNPWL